MGSVTRRAVEAASSVSMVLSGRSARSASSRRLDHDRRRPGLDAQVGIVPQGGRGQLEGKRVAAGERVGARRLKLAEAPRAKHQDRVGLAQRTQVQLAHQAAPSGRRQPGSHGRVAAGDDREERVGHRRQEGLAHPGVEDGEALVGVERQHGPPRHAAHEPGHAAEVGARPGRAQRLGHRPQHAGGRGLDPAPVEPQRR